MIICRILSFGFLMGFHCITLIYLLMWTLSSSLLFDIILQFLWGCIFIHLFNPISCYKHMTVIMKYGQINVFHFPWFNNFPASNFFMVGGRGVGVGSRWIGDSKLLKRIKFSDKFLDFLLLTCCFKIKYPFSYWKSCQRLHLRDPCGITLPKWKSKRWNGGDKTCSRGNKKCSWSLCKD